MNYRFPKLEPILACMANAVIRSAVENLPDKQRQAIEVWRTHRRRIGQLSQSGRLSFEALAKSQGVDYRSFKTRFALGIDALNRQLKHNEWVMLQVVNRVLEEPLQLFAEALTDHPEEPTNVESQLD
jgi:hypothetical protein